MPRAGRRAPVARAAETFRGFGPGRFGFFRALARHNERAWFEAHRADYESEVLLPLVRWLNAALGHARAERR